MCVHGMLIEVFEVERNEHFLWGGGASLHGYMSIFETVGHELSRLQQLLHDYIIIEIWILSTPRGKLKI